MELKSSYVIAVAEQLSFVSAFLGGISATILFSVIIFSSPKRSVSLVILSSALAACGLLTSVVSAWRLSIGLHPDLPFVANPKMLEILWNTMIGGYGIGLMSLLVCIGLSGWIRSNKLGLMTSVFATIAIGFFATTSIYTN